MSTQVVYPCEFVVSIIVPTYLLYNNFNHIMPAEVNLLILRLALALSVN